MFFRGTFINIRVHFHIHGIQMLTTSKMSTCGVFFRLKQVIQAQRMNTKTYGAHMMTNMHQYQRTEAASHISLW